jgi:hypothetical protein
MTGFCEYVAEPSNSTEQSPSWEAKSLSARQEISLLLLNLKFHYPVHKIPLLVPMTSQTNPVETFQPCYVKIHS